MRPDHKEEVGFGLAAVPAGSMTENNVERNPRTVLNQVVTYYPPRLPIADVL